MEDFSFDELKARKLINFLLEYDIKIYKKLVPEINKLDSEAIEKLFNGDADYDFNVKNQKIFKKLLDKFENFQNILEQWYKDEKYYEYIKILWSKYPCIEDLKDSKMEEIEEKMESYLIDFKNWPQEIKEELKKLIDQTSDTRVFELKKEIDNKYCQISSILKELVSIKSVSKQWKDEKKLISINANNLFMNLIEYICIPIGIYGLGSKWYGEVIQDKEKRYLAKQLCNEYKCSKATSDYLVEQSINDIKSNNFCGNYELPLNNQYDDVVEFNCNNGKLDNLGTLKKFKTFFKNNYVWGIHAGLSFINLFWSIHELRQTFKEADKIKGYETKLNNIIMAFKSHQELIGILPDNFNEATKHIKYILSLIKEDQKNLSDLIQEIIKRIEIQNSQKDKSVKGIFSSLGLLVFGVVGGVVTGGGTAIIYGVSSLANVISLAVNSKNYTESSNYLKQYHELLKKAMDEKSKMEKQYDELVAKLMEMVDKEKEKLEDEPKFDLYSSMSSISTNLDK